MTNQTAEGPRTGDDNPAGTPAYHVEDDNSPDLGHPVNQSSFVTEYPAAQYAVSALLDTVALCASSLLASAQAQPDDQTMRHAQRLTNTLRVLKQVSRPDPAPRNPGGRPPKTYNPATPQIQAQVEANAARHQKHAQTPCGAPPPTSQPTPQPLHPPETPQPCANSATPAESTFKPEKTPMPPSTSNPSEINHQTPNNPPSEITPPLIPHPVYNFLPGSTIAYPGMLRPASP